MSEPFSYSLLKHKAETTYVYAGLIAIVGPKGTYIYVPFEISNEGWREAIVKPFHEKDHSDKPDFSLDEYGVVKTVLKAASAQILKGLEKLL